MTDTHIAKLMWDAYAVQAGGITFDGKPLPTWDELGEDRQSCWVAAASVTASRIEKLETALEPFADLAYEIDGEMYERIAHNLEDGAFIKARKALEDNQ